MQFAEVWFAWAVLMKLGEASRPRIVMEGAEAAIWAVRGPSPQPMSRMRSPGEAERYDRMVVVSLGTKEAAAA